LKDKFSEESSGIKLSYLTLNIDDKLAQKDFVVHKTAIQNRKPFFWVVQFLVTVNLLNQCYRVFLKDENIAGLVSGILTTFHLQILWAVTCCRFQDKSQFIFVSWYVSVIAFNNFTAWNTESILFVQTM